MNGGGVLAPKRPISVYCASDNPNYQVASNALSNCENERATATSEWEVLLPTGFLYSPNPRRKVGAPVHMAFGDVFLRRNGLLKACGVRVSECKECVLQEVAPANTVLKNLFLRLEKSPARK